MSAVDIMGGAAHQGISLCNFRRAVLTSNEEFDWHYIGHNHHQQMTKSVREISMYWQTWQLQLGEYSSSWLPRKFSKEWHQGQWPVSPMFKDNDKLTRWSSTEQNRMADVLGLDQTCFRSTGLFMTTKNSWHASTKSFLWWSELVAGSSEVCCLYVFLLLSNKLSSKLPR